MSMIAFGSESITPLSRTPSAPSLYYKPSSPSKYNYIGNGGGLIDISHQRNIYNPARKMIYSRYSENDWAHSNKLHYHLSDQERSLGHNIRSEAWRAVKETDERTRRRQADNSAKLQHRRNDVNLWKEELISESRNMENELQSLQEHTRVLEKAYRSSGNPMHVAEECILHREKRTGIDVVHDEVERQLTREVKNIKDCQEMMKTCIQKAHVQLKMNRASLHELEKDTKNKNHAEIIDDRMFQLRNTSMGIGYYPGVETLDNTLSDPNSWLKFTQTNIARSQRDRDASERLRGEIDACLRACANSMWNQFNAVNNAFNTRVRETADAKERLQNHLQRVMKEIVDMDNNIDLLRKAIRDKEGYMKVAQTRLDERAKKLHVEICRDLPMNGIIAEVEEIKRTINKLRVNLKASEMSMARLMKTKSQLLNDISVKDNSLVIDARACMGLRRIFPKDGIVGPMASMPLIHQ